MFNIKRVLTKLLFLVLAVFSTPLLSQQAQATFDGVMPQNFSQFATIYEDYKGKSDYTIILLPQYHYGEGQSKRDKKQIAKIQKEILEVCRMLYTKGVTYYLNEGPFFSVDKEITKDEPAIKNMYNEMAFTEKVKQDPQKYKKTLKVMKKKRKDDMIAELYYPILKQRVKDALRSNDPKKEDYLYKLGALNFLVDDLGDKVHVFGSENLMLNLKMGAVVAFTSYIANQDLKDLEVMKRKEVEDLVGTKVWLSDISNGVITVSDIDEDIRTAFSEVINGIYDKNQSLGLEDFIDNLIRLGDQFQTERNIKVLESVAELNKKFGPKTLVVVYGASHMFVHKGSATKSFQELCKQNNVSYMLIKPNSVIVK